MSLKVLLSILCFIIFLYIALRGKGKKKQFRFLALACLVLAIAFAHIREYLIPKGTSLWLGLWIAGFITILLAIAFLIVGEWR
jgi:uncharacterized membrane protein